MGTINGRVQFILGIVPVLLGVSCSVDRSGSEIEISGGGGRRWPDKMVERAEWRSKLNWSQSCEDSFQRTSGGDHSGIQAYTLNPLQRLVSVLCSAGSYQPSFEYFLVLRQNDGNSVKSLRFPILESADGISVQMSYQTEIWGESMFDSPLGRLNILKIARQSGDCGIWSAYRFDASRPDLVEAWARLPCPASRDEQVHKRLARPPEGWIRVNHEKYLN